MGRSQVLCESVLLYLPRSTHVTLAHCWKIVYVAGRWDENNRLASRKRGDKASSKIWFSFFSACARVCGRTQWGILVGTDRGASYSYDMPVKTKRIECMVEYMCDI